MDLIILTSPISSFPRDLDVIFPSICLSISSYLGSRSSRTPLSSLILSVTSIIKMHMRISLVKVPVQTWNNYIKVISNNNKGSNSFSWQVKIDGIRPKSKLDNIRPHWYKGIIGNKFPLQGQKLNISNKHKNFVTSLAQPRPALL